MAHINTTTSLYEVTICRLGEYLQFSRSDDIDSYAITTPLFESLFGLRVNVRLPVITMHVKRVKNLYSIIWFSGT
jgi:hypothetical protein